MNALIKTFAASLVLVVCLIVAHTASASELVLRWVTPSGEQLDRILLTIEDVEALPQQTFTTNTPWTPVPMEFRGPSLADLAALGPGTPSKAIVVALNDYEAEIPADDWLAHGAILASRLEGNRMAIRDKGPLWIIYPIDQDRSLLNTQRYHSRMVWQVSSIDFLVE